MRARRARNVHYAATEVIIRQRNLGLFHYCQTALASGCGGGECIMHQQDAQALGHASHPEVFVEQLPKKNQRILEW